MTTSPLSESVSQGLRRAVSHAGEWLPEALTALAILAIGYVVSRALRALAVRLGRRLSRIAPEGRAQHELDEVVRTQHGAELLGKAVFWIGMVLSLMIATEALGLSRVSAWLGEIAIYLPRLVVAGVIVAVGVVFGRLAGAGIERAAESAGVEYGAGVGRFLRLGITVASFVVALDQLGLETTFLTTGLLIVVATMLGAAALAFGLGARTTVANILASHYLRKLYAVGQSVRIGERQGRIVDIKPTFVILQTDDGRLVIPAEQLATSQALLIPQEV